jgi:hypothetical protein
MDLVASPWAAILLGQSEQVNPAIRTPRYSEQTRRWREVLYSDGGYFLRICHRSDLLFLIKS